MLTWIAKIGAVEHCWIGLQSAERGHQALVELLLAKDSVGNAGARLIEGATRQWLGYWSRRMEFDRGGSHPSALT